MSNIKELLKLVSENPDLPVVPMVDYDVVADDGYSRWLGSFGYVYVGEYALFKDRFYDDREEFKEDYFYYYSDELFAKFNYEPRNNTKNEELEKYLDEVVDRFFKKAIIVNIDLPDLESEENK